MASALTAARVSSFPFYQDTSVHLAPGLWLSSVTTHDVLEGPVFFCDLQTVRLLREILLRHDSEQLSGPVATIFKDWIVNEQLSIHENLNCSKEAGL